MPKQSDWSVRLFGVNIDMDLRFIEYIFGKSIEVCVSLGEPPNQLFMATMTFISNANTFAGIDS